MLLLFAARRLRVSPRAGGRGRGQGILTNGSSV